MCDDERGNAPGVRARRLRSARGTANSRADGHEPEQSLRLDDRDRSRLVVASVITLVALPTIWLANRSDDGSASSRPNVAAVGIDPGRADGGASVGNAGFDPMGTSGAAYLDPPVSAAAAAPADVVIGTSGESVVATARATYKRSIYGGTCHFNGAPGGADVTIVNVANGRSIECTTERRDGIEDGYLLMSQAGFQRIAELTAAPIHVEIRK